MTTNADLLFVVDQARKYATEHWGCPTNEALRYAVWYVNQYSEGELSHSTAFPAWRDAWRPNLVCSFRPEVA